MEIKNKHYIFFSNMVSQLQKVRQEIEEVYIEQPLQGGEIKKEHKSPRKADFPQG